MTLYKTIADLNGGTQVAMTADEEAAHLAEQAANAAAQPRLDILAQIAALEVQQTPRRMREALLGTDAGWLDGKEDEIAALRAQL